MWLINLVINEIIKNFTRKKSVIFCVILLLSITALGIYHSRKQPNSNDWKLELNKKIVELKAENDKYQKDLETSNNKDDLAKMMIDMNNENIEIYSYAVQNDIPHNRMTSWKFADKATFLSILVLIFIIISASESIASEFSSGTIRYLVIRPLKRWKLIVGKFASLISFSVILLLISFLFSMILGSTLFGGKGINSVGLFYENGHVSEVSIIKLVFTKYVFEIIRLATVVSLALMISVLLRSSSVSLAVSLGVIIGGNLIVNALTQIQWMKYFLLTNLDLQQYLPGNKPFIKGMTIESSIVILMIYFIVFGTVSLLSFNKREIY